MREVERSDQPVHGRAREAVAAHYQPARQGLLPTAPGALCEAGPRGSSRRTAARKRARSEQQGRADGADGRTLRQKARRPRADVRVRRHVQEARRGGQGGR